MSKIGLNWNTLEHKTKKSLVLIISKIYKRLSPSLLTDTIISLSEINCTLNEIENISKELKIEYYFSNIENDINANDDMENYSNIKNLKIKNLNIMNSIDGNSMTKSNFPVPVQNIECVLTIQDNYNVISENVNSNISFSNINKVTEIYLENDDNQNYDKNELNRRTTPIMTKKRNIPLFLSFEKVEFFDLISNYISLGTYNNWELVQLLSCLSKLGNSFFFYYKLCFQFIIAVH